MIVVEEGETRGQQDLAHETLGLLSTVYPGHPWAVSVKGGVLFIRHLLNDNKGWGMNIRLTEVDHDAAVLRKKIVNLAGEWLERCGLRRGRFEDAEVTRVEGVPERAQDFRVRADRTAMQLVGGDGMPLRSEPLPKAVELAQQEKEKTWPTS